MQFSNIAKALAAMSLLHVAAAEEVYHVVYETQIVTVTAAAKYWESWRHWSPTTTATTPVSTSPVFTSPASTSPEPVPTTTSSTSSSSSTSTTSTSSTSSTPSPYSTPSPSSTSSPVSTVAPTSTPTTAASYPSGLSADNAAILSETNKYRSEYEAAAVTWNDTLADFALSWANRCYFAHSAGPYGENIAAAWPTLSATDGVDMWGNEESEYNWSDPDFTEDTGHFTQLVWQATTQIGCALVSCSNTDTSNGGIDNGDFLVCEYYPAGNVIGEFAENVLKPGASKRGVLGLAGRSRLGEMFG